MRYISTRDNANIDSMQAIIHGLAPGGGLFAPESFPDAVRFGLTDETLGYYDCAARVIGAYFTDYDQQEIESMVKRAYRGFTSQLVAPTVPLSGREGVLELFHGPTLAFKDFALQMLPQLLSAALCKTGEKSRVLILVATSGDTGKAALEGFRDVAGISIAVFYPNQGVSSLQRKQMVTQEGGNVNVFAINGNFDDAQEGVKRIFDSAGIKERLAQNGLKLSSANSINIGRLIPQVAYYFYAYMAAKRAGRLKDGNINFCVPTGNFGNILAAYYAKRMGLPINKLICASNSNNVLTDFFQTGTYDKNRAFYTTSSPSMDILVSSNLERLLFEVCGRDRVMLTGWMDGLKSGGSYKIGDEQRRTLQTDFYAGFADESTVNATIKSMLGEGYLADPHTAVGQAVYEDYARRTGDDTYTVLVSTASPFKFPSAILSALGEDGGGDEFAQCERLARISGRQVPPEIELLRSKPELHTQVCDPEAMEHSLFAWLGK